MVQPPSDDRRRLTDLRRAQPADATMQNLLQVISGKIELCGQLVIYEYEASSEGHTEAAATFRELGEVERSSYESLVKCLTDLLAERPAEEPTSAGIPPRRTRFKGSPA